MQPLSKVLKDPNATIRFGNTAHLESQPGIATQAMKIIAGAVTIEASYTRFFIWIMGAQPYVGAAIYQGVNADSVRDSMLKSAVEAALSPRAAELFSALDTVTTTALKWRHKMAHWTWGSTPALPDALLIVDPKEYVPVSVGLAKAFRGNPSDVAQAPLRLNRDKVFVVREADLQRATKTITRAQKLCLAYETFLALETRAPSEADPEYARLSAEPEIQEALGRLRKPKAAPEA